VWCSCERGRVLNTFCSRIRALPYCVPANAPIAGTQHGSGPRSWQKVFTNQLVSVEPPIQTRCTYRNDSTFVRVLPKAVPHATLYAGCAIYRVFVRRYNSSPGQDRPPDTAKCAEIRRSDHSQHRRRGHKRRASDWPKMMRRCPCDGLRTPSPRRDSLYGVRRTTQAVLSCVPTMRNIEVAERTQHTSDAHRAGRKRCADAHAADCGPRHLDATVYTASDGPPKLF